MFQGSYGQSYPPIGLKISGSSPELPSPHPLLTAPFWHIWSICCSILARLPPFNPSKQRSGPGAATPIFFPLSRLLLTSPLPSLLLFLSPTSRGHIVAKMSKPQSTNGSESEFEFIETPKAPTPSFEKFEECGVRTTSVRTNLLLSPQKLYLAELRLLGAWPRSYAVCCLLTDILSFFLLSSTPPSRMLLSLPMRPVVIASPSSS